ncbi:hypothetical protein [Rhodoblastus sp.]|uniref:hypothetical protein n=1 Tax=Rhodoblastus sp. TaxID=1962975 RepID=UPI003F998B06
MTDFRPIQFALMPPPRRALRIAELFSLETDQQPLPAHDFQPGFKIEDTRQLREEVQPRRSTAM